MITPLVPCSEACPGHDPSGNPCERCWASEVLRPTSGYYIKAATLNPEERRNEHQSPQLLE